MNKKAVGDFLRTLRNEKNLTQNKLSEELEGIFGCIYSAAAISKWERGESVPNIDDLQKLAKFYNVSVDEILNGIKYEEVNFEIKYFICNDGWLSQYNSDDLYDIREEQELIIETRFKELLRKMVGNGLSLSEDKEFDFIVSHFYRIFPPAINYKNAIEYDNFELTKSIWGEDVHKDLANIKFEIYKQTALMHNSTNEEKYWEANKKFIFSRRQNIWNDINNVIEDRQDELNKRLKTLEDVEKDILLACLQRTNVINTLAVGSPKGKELYEKRYGRKYDEEQLTKRAIRLLIECGAKLNKTLLGYWQVKTSEHSIIDELELLHKKYKAHLLVQVYENGEYHYFHVDNTESNRARLGIKYEDRDFDEKDYQSLEERLYDGENTILKPQKAWASNLEDGKDKELGRSLEEWKDFVHARKQIINMPLESYIWNRDNKMTEELLENLDILSLEKLRERYFPSEYRGEYINDKRFMSHEELRKKYYIKETTNE